MALSMKDRVTLKSGHKMPIVGLGTWQCTPEETEQAIDAALEMGYRHIDTAYAYKNEAAIGHALKKWLDSGSIKREDLFITTKLPGIAMRPERVSDFVKKSLAALQVEYLDCYLIHSPIGLKYFGDDNIWAMVDGKITIDRKTDLVAIWHALEKEVDAGKIRTIGVSNFDEEQMERVDKAAQKHKIAVNQVELHAYFQQKALQRFCSQRDIIIMAYAPLGSPGRKTFIATAETQPIGLLSDPVVSKIAKEHRVTPAQVLLHHLAEKGLVVIPKSTNPTRIQLNFQIFNFTLSSEERESLDNLDKDEAGRTFTVGAKSGIDEHPECRPNFVK